MSERFCKSQYYQSMETDIINLSLGNREMKSAQVQPELSSIIRELVSANIKLRSRFFS